MLDRRQTANRIYENSLMSIERLIEIEEKHLRNAAEAGEKTPLTPTWPGTAAIGEAIRKHEQACLELAASVECIYCRKEW